MSRQLIVLTDEELDLLYDHPADVMKAYICLRRRMDFGTGIVGAVSGVSWWALREDMSVGAGQGRSDHGTPTEKMVRNKVEILERLGLVERRTLYRKLIFCLPKAYTAQARQKEVGRTWVGQVGQEVGRIESQEQQGFYGEAGREVGRMEIGEVGHTSGSGKPSFSVSNKVPPPCTEPVDNFGAENPVVVAVGGFMELLRKAERRRNCVIRIRDTDPLLTAWVKNGVTLELLQSAYDEAAWDREKHNDPQPINASFLNTILRRKLNAKAVCRRSDSGTPRAWHSHAEGIAAKAQEIGLARHEGEDDQTFKGRVCFEVSQIEAAAREAKKHGR